MRRSPRTGLILFHDIKLSLRLIEREDGERVLRKFQGRTS